MALKKTRVAGRRRRGRPPADAAATHACRDRIVDTAAALFARNGFARTTTAAIARESGTSDGTLFHHFPTKRALLAEVGRREGQRVLDLAFDGVDPAAPPPDPRQLIGPLFDYAHRAPDTYRLFAMDGDLEDLESGFSAKRDLIVGGLAGLLAGWSARGFVRRMDPDVVAALVFAVVDAAVRRLVLEDRWSEREVWESESCRAVRTLLGLAAAPSTG